MTGNRKFINRPVIRALKTEYGKTYPFTGSMVQGSAVKVVNVFDFESKAAIYSGFWRL
jgi:hypothetical protein